MQRKMYELTNPQKSIWFTEEVFKDTPISNIAGTVLIDDKVDFNLLEEAINIFVERNYSFRLKFVIENQTVKQYVEPYSRFSIEKINVHSINQLKPLVQKSASTVFNVLNSRLFEFKLVQFDDGHGGFILSIHHLICDAWTSGFIASEIIRIYSLLLKNENTDDMVYPSYVDYIYAEQEYLQSEKYKKDKDFWNKIFEVVPEIATIPGDIHDEKNDSSCSSQRKQFTMQKALINSINEFCKTFKISIYNFFIAVYSIYIGRVSGLDDFVIGSPILNRSNTKEKHTCGMFINTVPIKISLTNKLKFTDFVSNIASSLFNILKHQKYQYLSILEDLRHKDSSIPNLYNILISYQNMRTTAQTSEVPFNMNWTPNGCVSDDIDIHIFDLNDTGNFNIAYDYRVSKYSEAEIEKIHERLINIIQQVLKNENVLIDDLEILTDDEKKTLLLDFNNTAVSYNKTETLSMLIEKQALKTPDRVALVFEDKEMTYKELNEKSNSLANYLRNHGVQPNDIVGIMVNRSFEMIISILAVLKAGGAYIPIDPEYPQDRVEYMLQNSNAKFLLTFEKLKNKVVFDNMLFVELDNAALYSNSSASLKCVNKPEDSSYVIYTSGSTGVPKGVVLTHKALSNLTNYFNNYIEYLKNNTYRTIVSVTTVSFDIFIFETLISLQRGLKLVIANEDEQNLPRLLNNLIEKHNITIIQTTPARMQLFVNNYSHIPALKKLDFITLAGEQLPITLANQLKEISGCTLYNGYGPSETTVFSTLTDVTKQEIITIGKPLDNTYIYILDKNLHLVPTGCIGEIYIAGDGLGKGYLNRPDLTEKAFIPNPFVPGTLMYKTGDLGTFRADGEILCFGRCDNQVKIRGLRIELEEIEKRILENNNINNCVVTKQVDNNSHEFLCAYYTTIGKVDVSDLRKYLTKLLPKYMVPQYFMELERLPYTPNGKINRKLLPSPKPEQKVKTMVLPRNDTDKILVKLLQDLIVVKDISMNDSFFDLGGDSLTAINLCTRVYDSFSAIITVKDIFEHPVIMELSDIISVKTGKANKFTLQKAPELTSYPLSFAEQGIYFASIVAGNNSVLYNVPGGLLLNKLLDVAKLEQCFQALVNRHEVLRTYFTFNKDTLVQKIKKSVKFVLDVDETPIKEKDIKKYYNSFVKPFDLSIPPLFRAKLINIEDSQKYKALLLFDIHHIICDGTSAQILINELCKLYNSEELPILNYTYKDFAWSEQELLSTNQIKEAEKYWVSQFEDNIPVLEMPTNFPRPAVQSFDGSKVYFSVSDTIVDKIAKICKDLEITPYMFTLSAYYVLLNKYTSQNDIIVGSPINGRSFAETNNIVGMFVNTLPVRLKFNEHSSFKELLGLVKDKCSNNFKYQYYPFDELVKKLNIKRDTSRNPIFDTLFTFQNTMSKSATFGDINVTIYSDDNSISKFDLSLEIVPNNNSFDMNFEYCTRLFTKNFIQNLSKQYVNILEKLVDNIDLSPLDIKLLPEGKNLVGLADMDLGKVENLIYQYPNIDKAIVLLNDAGKLTAYFSAKQQITMSDLQAFLQRNLSSNYIPEQIIQVDKFALTDSGEIDVSALIGYNSDVSNHYEKPITNYQKKLAKMFKDVLKLDDVSINDNFFDLGGDSLFAIQLQIEAFNNGLEFSYRDIFTYPTIKQLSEQISKKSKAIKEDNYDYTKINELISKNTGKVKLKKEKFKNILLTGATGYLGSHILNDLMINTRCNVYCLIRAKNNTDPQTRLLDTLRFYFGPKYDKYIFKRIFVIEGDITAPNFGLDDTYYQKIGESISCVINSAAIVKHYGNSQIFNATNVSGTQNIIDFCSKFNCKLMHLSTLSVSGNIFDTESYQVANVSTKTEFSEKDLYIGQDLSNVYIHTKFIAERLILENIVNNNLNAKIIRLGNITNRYSDGAFQINVSENAFINRIHSFMQLECFPDYLLDNYMEFTPVDFCADAIVCLTMFKNPFTIFHVFNNNHITFRELKIIFDKLHINMKIVTKEEFNSKVTLFSNNPTTRNAISGIINDFGKDKKLKYYTNISIKNDFTNKLLKTTLFRWPKINKHYMQKLLIYLKSIGYIK